MKGQIEISFQWVFVLIAGGTLLLLILLSARFCSQQGIERDQSESLEQVATAITLAALRPEGNSTAIATDVTVLCPDTTLILQHGAAREEIHAAVFLPPAMHGEIELITQEINIDSLSFGSIAYAIDKNTYYYVLIDNANYTKVSSFHDQFFPIDASSTAQQQIPSTALTVVYISTGPDLAQLQLPKTSAKIYGVTLTNDDAKFYEQRNNKLVPIYTAKQHEMFGIAAAISARPRAYVCSLSVAAMRAKQITALSEDRVDLLLALPLENQCKTLLSQAKIELNAINAMNNTALLSQLQTLKATQNALYENSCPTII